MAAYDGKTNDHQTHIQFWMLPGGNSRRSNIEMNFDSENQNQRGWFDFRCFQISAKHFSLKRITAK